VDDVDLCSLAIAPRPSRSAGATKRGVVPFCCVAFVRSAKKGRFYDIFFLFDLTFKNEVIFYFGDACIYFCVCVFRAKEVVRKQHSAAKHA
jgi:hypothetical protein